jgi:hypothetical protein
MIREPINQGGAGARKKPQGGQRADRAMNRGYMPPNNMNRNQQAEHMRGATTAPQKSKFKKALPYIIAGGGTAMASGGLLGYLFFS